MRGQALMRWNCERNHGYDGSILVTRESQGIGLGYAKHRRLSQVTEARSVVQSSDHRCSLIQEVLCENFEGTRNRSPGECGCNAK